MPPVPSLARAVAQAEAQLLATFARANASLEAQLHGVSVRIEHSLAAAERSFAERTAWLDRLHRNAVRPRLPSRPMTDPSTITTATQPIVIGVNDPAALRAIQERLRRPRPPYPGWN